jgi:hypothetical protein
LEPLERRVRLGDLPKTLDIGGSAQMLYRREHVDRFIRETHAVRIYGMANTTPGSVESKSIPTP